MKHHQTPQSNCDDPAIVAAQDEILAVMKKHDLGGAVILQSPMIAHFFLVIDPTWSCAFYVPEKNAVWIRCLRKDFPTLEAQKKKLEDTTGLLLGNQQLCDVIKDNMEQVLLMIGHKMAIESKNVDLGNWERFDLE